MIINTRNVLNSAPISISEFFGAFARIWLPTAAISQHRDARLNVGRFLLLELEAERKTVFVHRFRTGLAISGGVDSMALAALCSKLHEVDLAEFSASERFGFDKRHRFSFTAFIVDHGARIGSGEEASLVSKNLDRIGIPAQILPLQWPGASQPTELSNFESRARTLRYQALGKACYDHQIEPLLTAHHEDDQVETVIMRLLRGDRGMALQGMRSVSHIPECHGIYGVNRSGGVSSQSEQQNGRASAPGLGSPKLIHIPVEDGGVRLHRPLLQFSKSRLVATSIHLEVPWFEDKTNADPTLTPRNAIRHVYKEDLMPKALSKTAILRLAHRMQAKLSLEEAKVDSLLFTPHVVTDINWSSGSLKVRFPNILRNATEEEARNLEKRRAALLLRRLISFVTPFENVLLSSLRVACEAVFPDLFHERMAEGHSISTTKQVKAFTVAGVYFMRMLVPRSRPAQGLKKKHLDPELDNESLWVLSRQLYKRAEESPCITFPPTSTDPREPIHSTCSNKRWSPWHLYDGRFWIRVLNRGSSTVFIRPFNEHDMSKFNTWPKHMCSNKRGKILTTSEISKEDFVRFMRNAFPGNIRYTLPAIVAMNEGKETALALPTVGVACGNIEEMCLDWDIRYKCVDWARQMARWDDNQHHCK